MRSMGFDKSTSLQRLPAVTLESILLNIYSYLPHAWRLKSSVLSFHLIGVPSLLACAQIRLYGLAGINVPILYRNIAICRGKIELRSDNKPLGRGETLCKSMAVDITMLFPNIGQGAQFSIVDQGYVISWTRLITIFAPVEAAQARYLYSADILLKVPSTSDTFVGH